MKESEKEHIEQQAREDARTGIYSGHSEIAAVNRLGNTSGPENDAYQKAFKQEQEIPATKAGQGQRNSFLCLLLF